MFPPNARVECTKTPEQIREEAAKAAAVDLAAICQACGIQPNDDARLQTAAQLYWRHRDEIASAATTVHFCSPENPCDAKKAEDGDDAKVTH